jgi:DNA-binding MarR family transcriptional regulator
VCLTPKGRKAFEKIASVHEGWVIELMAGVTDADKQQLYELLGRLRVQLSAQQSSAAAERRK